MDVYEDIEKAKKVINYSKFTHMGYNLIYPFTTENLNGYMNKLDFKNKKVLTVGSSADQILNVFLLGCKDITLLDINPFVKYYFDLKVAGLLSLQIEDFLSFFTYNKGLFKNKNSFNHETFNKIKNYLNENSYIFWNTLYKEYDNCGLIIRKNLFTMDEYKEKVVSLSNNYLRSVENYNLIKSNIENCNPSFLTSDIRNVSNLTKEKYDFGDGPFIPCEVIHLPEPIMKPSITVEKKEETLTEPIEKVETEETPKIKPEAETRTIKPVSNPKLDIKQSGGFGNTVKKAFKAVVDFSNRHPVLTGIVKAVGVAGLAAAADAVANGGRSSSGDSSSGDYSYTPSRTGSDTFDDSYDEILTGDVDTDTSAERSSPKEHTVRPHGQHYIKNGERVWIEKEVYPRGGKKDE